MPTKLLEGWQGKRRRAKARGFFPDRTPRKLFRHTFLRGAAVENSEDTKVVISIYKRKKREVLNKIKKAGIIAYEFNL